MLDKELTEKIIDFAKARPEISVMYIFGSHALGHERKGSDIDLGILFNKDMDGFRRIEMETEVSNILKKDVDLVDMKKAELFLRHQIHKYGKLIYHDESDFAYKFKADSIRDYLETEDFRILRREILYG